MAEVFGHRYGTPRAPVEAAVAAGRDMLFDIDWQAPSSCRKDAQRPRERFSCCRQRRGLRRRLIGAPRTRRGVPTHAEAREITTGRI
jgi:guanylate kinase